MQIEIDKTKCIGSLPCIKIAPTVFKLGEDGKAYILDPKAASDSEIRQAAMTCPQNAITLKDDEGKVIYPAQD